MSRFSLSVFVCVSLAAGASHAVASEALVDSHKSESPCFREGMTDRDEIAKTHLACTSLLSDRTTSARDQVLANYYLARMYQLEKDLEKAEQHFLAATDIAPDHFGSSYFLAEISYQRGDNDTALERINHFNEHYVSDSDGYYLRALILTDMGRLENGELDFRTAIRLNSDVTGYHYFFIDNLMKQGKLNAADEHLTEAMKRFPDDDDYSLLKSMLLHEFEAYEEMLRVTESALENEPQNYSLRFQRARALQALQRHEDAICLLYTSPSPRD